MNPSLNKFDTLIHYINVFNLYRAFLTNKIQTQTSRVINSFKPFGTGKGSRHWHKPLIHFIVAVAWYVEGQADSSPELFRCDQSAKHENMLVSLLAASIVRLETKVMGHWCPTILQNCLCNVYSSHDQADVHVAVFSLVMVHDVVALNYTMCNCTYQMQRRPPNLLILLAGKHLWAPWCFEFGLQAHYNFSCAEFVSSHLALAIEFQNLPKLPKFRASTWSMPSRLMYTIPCSGEYELPCRVQFSLININLRPAARSLKTPCLCWLLADWKANFSASVRASRRCFEKRVPEPSHPTFIASIKLYVFMYVCMYVCTYMQV